MACHIDAKGKGCFMISSNAMMTLELHRKSQGIHALGGCASRGCLWSLLSLSGKFLPVHNLKASEELDPETFCTFIHVHMYTCISHECQ